MIVIWLFYVTILLATLRITSWLWVWAGLEILNWLFLVLLRGGLLRFLLWQGWATLIFLAGVGPLHSSICATIGLLAKSALPPLTWWFLPNLDKWELFSWVWFLSLAKILPLALLCQLRFILFLAPLIRGARILFFLQNFSWKETLLASSIRDRGWILAGGELRTIIFIFFMISYTALWLLWVNWHTPQTRINIFSKLMLMLTVGLPPSIFFVIKVATFCLLPTRVGIILALLAVLILIIYFYWLIISRLSFSSLPASAISWRQTIILLTAHLAWGISFL